MLASNVEMTVPAGTAPPGEVTPIPSMMPTVGLMKIERPFCTSAAVRLLTEASSMFLSSTVSTDVSSSILYQ